MPVLKDLESGGAVFGLAPSLQVAYGNADRFDLSEISGLLAYAIDFANRDDEPSEYLPDYAEPRGREQLRLLFRAAVYGPQTGAPDVPDLANPSNRFLNNLWRRTSSIHWTAHVPTRTPTGAVWMHYAWIDNADAFIAFMTTVLLDERNRRLIGHCKGCDKAFMMTTLGERGRPERFYHPECRKTARNKAEAKRQAALRKRQKVLDMMKTARVAAARDAVSAALKDDPDAQPDQLAARARVLMQRARKKK
jgi:hypothetical protein